MAFTTNFKVPRSAKVERARKRIDRKAAEDKNKKTVRLRDRRCRMPLCGCQKFGIVPHVSHQRHKGIGGNPKGDRSQPEIMVYICRTRHRELAVSIDRGTLQWHAIDPELGAAGPIAWWADWWALPKPRHLREPTNTIWVELAREVKRGQLAPLTDAQRATLEQLAEMK